jgi:hypothetical protein
MKLEITEEDHRRIDEAVAEHDPTGWLMSNRIRVFSEEDAEFYADHNRAELRASLVAALMAEAVENAITELGGTLDDSFNDIEASVREMMTDSRPRDIERWRRIVTGISDKATDEDCNRHYDQARAVVVKEAV